MTIQEFRTQFDPQFSEYVEKRVSEYANFTTNSRILQIIKQSSDIAGHGKRVRPYLTALSYLMHGGRDLSSITPILFAIEIFHTFCLIHDDIIDEDDYRRNIQTVHSRARDLYIEKNRGQNNREKTGNAQAILVGDLSFSWVFELLISHPMARQLASEFFYTVDEVVIGQMIDVDLALKPDATKSEIMEKMHMKTAGYTFIQPLRIGRILAGLPARDEVLDSVALEIGIAFQIQDDLLDIMSSTEVIGKDAGSDAETAQHTLLTQFVFDHATQNDIRELKLLLGTAIDEDRLFALQELFKRTGAVASLTQEINERFAKAYKTIEKLQLPQHENTKVYTDHLINFLKYVESRQV
jgi:geranylgeranyl diphosphate synthase type I